jgi:hypothetical protein
MQTNLNGSKEKSNEENEDRQDGCGDNFSFIVSVNATDFQLIKNPSNLHTDLNFAKSAERNIWNLKMSNLEDEFIKLIRRTEKLESEIRVLQANRFNVGDQIVGVDYVAAKFGCSEEAVVRGRFKTGRIKRVRQKPIGFKKSDVDKVWTEITKTPVQKAAEYIAEANDRKYRKRGV